MLRIAYLAGYYFMGIFTQQSLPASSHNSDGLVFHDNIHANSVFYEGITFLLRGASGSGKSDLTLRMIDHGGTLIADDRTLIYSNQTHIFLAPHENIAGQIEVRGIDIIKVPYIKLACCDVILDLCNTYPRYRTEKTCFFYEKMLNYYKINPFEKSILAKLKIIAHYIKYHQQE